MSKPGIDWELIERDYRAGILSIREIGTAHGITHGAINKRAKRDGWERDLGVRIQAKADILVAKAEARVAAFATKEGQATEREIVEANATRIAQVRSEHRQDITRVRNLVLRLLAECEAVTDNQELFAELGEMLRNPDDNGMDRLNDAYRKAIDLPTRIKGVKELSETLKTLVGLEREAYGIASAAEQALSDAQSSGSPYQLNVILSK